MNIVCVVEKKRKKALNGLWRVLRKWHRAILHNFTVAACLERKILETEQSLIVLGDVCKGSCVVSKKDIVVLGTLSGSAYAGVDGKAHFIAALHMEPESVRIGEHRGKYKK